MGVPEFGVEQVIGAFAVLIMAVILMGRLWLKGDIRHRREVEERDRIIEKQDRTIEIQRDTNAELAHAVRRNNEQGETILQMLTDIRGHTVLRRPDEQ